METVAIKGLKRKETGKKATKALRRDGLIPCAMYGMGDATHFSVSFKDVKPLIYTASFKVAEIDIDGSKHKCIVKERHFHPVSESIEHIEFIELLDNRKVTVDIPVRLEGSSAGVKTGGLLQQNLRRITIKTTAGNLVNELVLDVTELEIGQSVRVRDLEELEGVEVMSPGGTPVATVEVPRALKSLEAEEAEEGEEGVEGEEGEGAEGAEGDASAE